MTEIFKDLKVLELASVLAGPMVGTFFAELGANVIKVENKLQGGDPTRQWKQSSEPDIKISSYYAAANYNKKSILLDLTNEVDYELFITEIKNADVVISNFNDSTAKKLKVTYENISKINSNIIYAQLYAFSKEIDRSGYDMVMQAECGFLSMCGEGDNYARMPVALIDLLAAHQMKEAILIALLNRSKNQLSGIPQYLEVSLYKSAIASLANQASNFLMNDQIPKRMGTMHPNIAPYGDLYKLSDNKMIMLAVGSDSQFEKLVETLNLNKDDFTKFMYNKARVFDREGLNELIQSIFINLRSDEVEEKLRRKRIPYCFIQNLKEVFGHPLAKDMIRSEVIEGHLTHGVKTISFST